MLYEVMNLFFVSGFRFSQCKHNVENDFIMYRKFPVQRKTLNLKVPYYVKENFHTEYQGSLRRLEITVEEEYVTNLRHSCYREKNYSK